MRGVLRREQPRSDRGRLVALLVAVGIVAGILCAALAAVGHVRAVDRQQQALHAQAAVLVQTIAAAPPAATVSVSSQGAQLLPGTQVVVTRAGHLIWANAALGGRTVSANATAGAFAVRVVRAAPGIWRGAWLVLAGIVIAVAAAAVGWRACHGRSAPRDGDVEDLAVVAAQVAQGRLDVRASVTDSDVGDIARVFNLMTARLEHEDARQRDFLADVAHELRTPVTAIEGFAQALHDGTARTPEAREEAFEVIREEASRLREFVRELQELTWLDLDPPVNLVPTDLVDLARSEVSRQSISARNKGVELEAPEGEVPITTDPAHVRTIVANLIANAINATPAGGRVEVRVGASRGPFGADAFIAVIDTGVGIREEHVPLLFDRLFRVDTVRARQDGRGSGLGLSIVKRLTTILDARMTVVSDLGQGSTFTLWLNDAQRRRPAPPPEPRDH